MTNSTDVRSLQEDCRQLFDELAALQTRIREKLIRYADGKVLKGNELVAWLGEIYGKLLLDGTLVDESKEHDFVSSTGWRVSVKTRKGFKTGWQRSSAIPKIEGKDCPSHLLFVHLNDDYSIDRIWLFPWKILLAQARLKKHTVRGSHRSFIFSIDEAHDKDNVIFVGDTKRGND